MKIIKFLYVLFVCLLGIGNVGAMDPFESFRLALEQSKESPKLVEQKSTKAQRTKLRDAIKRGKISKGSGDTKQSVSDVLAEIKKEEELRALKYLPLSAAGATGELAIHVAINSAPSKGNSEDAAMVKYLIAQGFFIDQKAVDLLEGKSTFVQQAIEEGLKKQTAEQERLAKERAEKAFQDFCKTISTIIDGDEAVSQISTLLASDDKATSIKQALDSNTDIKEAFKKFVQANWKEFEKEIQTRLTDIIEIEAPEEEELEEEEEKETEADRRAREEKEREEEEKKKIDAAQTGEPESLADANVRTDFLKIVLSRRIDIVDEEEFPTVPKTATEISEIKRLRDDATKKYYQKIDEVSLDEGNFKEAFKEIVRLVNEGMKLIAQAREKIKSALEKEKKKEEPKPEEPKPAPVVDTAELQKVLSTVLASLGKLKAALEDISKKAGETKAEEPKDKPEPEPEPAPEPKKPEPKKEDAEEPKDEPAAEPKTAEPKPEPKKAGPKPGETDEPKEEPKGGEGESGASPELQHARKAKSKKPTTHKKTAPKFAFKKPSEGLSEEEKKLADTKAGTDDGTAAGISAARQEIPEPAEITTDTPDKSPEYNAAYKSSYKEAFATERKRIEDTKAGEEAGTKAGEEDAKKHPRKQPEIKDVEGKSPEYNAAYKAAHIRAFTSEAPQVLRRHFQTLRSKTLSTAEIDGRKVGTADAATLDEPTPKPDPVKGGIYGEKFRGAYIEAFKAEKKRLAEEKKKASPKGAQSNPKEAAKKGK